MFQDKAFPFFDELAKLVEGTKAVGKYATSTVRPVRPASPNRAGPSDSHLDALTAPALGLTDHLLHRPSSSDNDTDEPEGPAAKRHRMSAAIKPLQGPPKKKKSTVDQIQAVSNHLGAMSDTFERSVTHTMEATSSLAADPKTAITRASEQLSTSGLTEEEKLDSLDMFISQPAVAEAYLGCSASMRDAWMARRVKGSQ